MADNGKIFETNDVENQQNLVTWVTGNSSLLNVASPSSSAAVSFHCSSVTLLLRFVV